MSHFRVRNINQAFRELVKLFRDELSTPPDNPYTDDWSVKTVPVGRRESRNGPVARIIGPVTITYTRPLERSLWNAARDVNPFSLLYEGMWTLAGRRDVAPIAYYTPRMSDYSDDGINWHGAYGHRWRHHFGGDQLDTAVEALRADRWTRRAVLEMWDPRTDLLDPPAGARDLPCNTHAYLEVDDGLLNLTVCNRSNDLVWGALAANYCVFSFLLEYLAARVGVPVGVYNQFSNNMHVYDWNFKPAEWLADPTPDLYVNANLSTLPPGTKAALWGRDFGPDGRVPLVKDPARFDAEVKEFVEWHSRCRDPREGRPGTASKTEPFLRDVMDPMMYAFHCHKVKDHDAAWAWASRVADPAWAAAAMAWLERRALKREAKT